MVVAATRRHQGEVAGQGEKPASFGSWLVGVVDLQAGQARGS